MKGAESFGSIGMLSIAAAVRSQIAAALIHQ